MDLTFDAIIVGGGIAGLLTAQRLCASNPELKVLVLEKESRLGGRAVTGGTAHHYGYGFQAITPRLYEFWNQALKSDPEADDLPSLVNNRLKLAGILMGNKMTEVDSTLLFSDRGARALGGLAASRQWPEVKSLFEAEDRFEHTFADRWKAPRKSPATLVLETYAQAFGVNNIWECSPGGIAERIAPLSALPYSGDWQRALDALVQPYLSRGQLTLELDARVIDATYSEQEGWELDTAKGTFKAKSIVVAQPPWTAFQWLPKQLWPAQLATMVSKTKPVSAVTLSCSIEAGDVSELPQLIFIPSESCQAIVSSSEIVIQATIDYEMSMVAPDVVKSVKRLKRALKKLLLVVPDVKTGIEHVALVPVSWAQTLNTSERKHIDKLKMNALQKPHLAFCGDAYGQSLDGDTNLIESVISSSEALLS